MHNFSVSISIALALFVTACASTHSACDLDASRSDTRAPCDPLFVDEGDACVAWRAIPTPPCSPVSLVHRGAEVAVHCAAPYDQALTPLFTWDERSGAAEPVLQVVEEPSLVLTFPDGSQLAVSTDVYAHPFASRTDASGAWRPTIPPPSAFVRFGAVLSNDEAVFVGDPIAYVFEIRRR